MTEQPFAAWLAEAKEYILSCEEHEEPPYLGRALREIERLRQQVLEHAACDERGEHLTAVGWKRRAEAAERERDDMAAEHMKAVETAHSLRKHARTLIRERDGFCLLHTKAHNRAEGLAADCDKLRKEVAQLRKQDRITDALCNEGATKIHELIAERDELLNRLRVIDPQYFNSRTKGFQP